MKDSVEDRSEGSCSVKAAIAYFSKASSIGPSSRYRICQFLPYLSAVGMECRIFPLFGPVYYRILEFRNPVARLLVKVVYVGGRLVKRSWDLMTLPRVDVVVIEGQLFPYAPAWLERLILRVLPTVVLEFDDAIYLTRFHQSKIPALLKSVSESVVGNEVLARYARQYCSHVSVIPTVVDTRRFTPAVGTEPSAREDGQRLLRVVWIGLAYNLEYLDIVVPALRALSEQGLVCFRVICSHPPVLKGVNMEFRPWSMDLEATDLRECHIGIMPLPDTEWARGKCGLKLLQYMACGLATVASPVGVNREIVRDNETGFLAASPSAWYEKLYRLCQDDELRARLGRAGRQRVEGSYSLARWGPLVAEHYLDLARRSAVPHRSGEALPTAARRHVEVRHR
jgi:glycosyltransferase involved in cell wall biosynthesis